ncbi:MAG: outer membrane beta-barrel family protein [Cyclobacteriaceae bacterium]
MKTYLKTTTWIFLLSILVFSQQAEAQTSITGYIHKVDGTGVPFATVQLINKEDSSFVVGAVSDYDGKFEFEFVSTGIYLLKSDAVGFKTQLKTYNISEDGNAFPVLEIVMEEDLMQLQEVVVKARKPFHERHADRLVIHVKGSPASTGSTVLEILERSPGVTVNRQGGTISLNGRTGIQVMINGKLTKMPMDAVIQMLDGLSAADIETLEFFNTPPAQFDAEGAGLINIKTSKPKDQGLNGSAGVNIGYNKGEKIGTSFSIQHVTGRVSLYSSYSLNYDRNKHQWFNYRTMKHGQADVSLSNISHRNPVVTVQNARLGWILQFSKMTSTSVELTGFKRNWDQTAYTTNVERRSDKPEKVTGIDIDESNLWGSGSVSVGLRHDFGDDQQVNVMYDYLAYHNENPSIYRMGDDPSETGSLSQITVAKTTPIHFHIIKTDFSSYLGARVKASVGLKYTQSRFTNKVDVSETIDNLIYKNLRFSNFALLDEQIFANFLSVNWELNEALNLQSGVRFELTDSNIRSKTEQILYRRYGNFFPSALLTHQILDHLQVHASFARRITRPTFNDMAPFVFFISPSTLISGNSTLQSALINNYEIGYQSPMYSVTARYSIAENEIGFLQPEYSEDFDEHIFSSQNLEYQKTLALTQSVNLTLTPWWELQSSVSLYHQHFKTAHFEENFTSDVKRVSFSAMNIFDITRDLQLELSGNYESRNIWGITQFRPMGEINLGIRKKFDKYGTLTLSATDIFNTYIWRMHANIPQEGIQSGWDYYENKRSINLSYTLNFGKETSSLPKRKSASETERSRVQ